VLPLTRSCSKASAWLRGTWKPHMQTGLLRKECSLALLAMQIIFFWVLAIFLRPGSFQPGSSRSPLSRAWTAAVIGSSIQRPDLPLLSHGGSHVCCPAHCFSNCRESPAPTTIPMLNLCTASTRFLPSFPVNYRQ